MADEQDHYEALGVSPTSEFEVIKAAYRALMREDHPDALNVRAGGTARLNVPRGATSQTFVDVPAPMYDAIFRLNDPEPYMLQLLVDRVTGNGSASLKVGDFPVLSRSFQLSQFQATAAQPSLLSAPRLRTAALQDKPSQCMFVTSEYTQGSTAARLRSHFANRECPLSTHCGH